ncbi:hypothetical protein B0H34DRAFT_648175 [Crassisporium funariophilum]|nr:hypothetical protein B0H34DRAFT_648175 [Crassisporium funariophilum]
MVHWLDTSEIARDSDVFQKLVFALFGAYLWELFMTCDFEWSLLKRRRVFRWPLVIFFFLCRYCMLLAFNSCCPLCLMNLHIQALYTFNSWTGNMTILCASTSLMLRTIALWERRKSVIMILGTLCLAHWALLYRTMFIVVSEWEPAVKSCVVVQTNPSMLNTTFFFTMGFDFIILLFTAVALLARHSARTDLWKLLFQDGLVYFLVSFSTNCIPAVQAFLLSRRSVNDTDILPVTGAECAQSEYSIAACRAVMRLLEFSAGDVYVHSISAAMTGSNPPAPRHSLAPHIKSQKPTRPEIHVTTEHITMTEFP